MKQFETSEWSRRGKKYKAKTMSSFKQLYGEWNNGKDCQFREEEKTELSGAGGTDQIRDVVEETGLLLPSQSKRR